MHVNRCGQLQCSADEITGRSCSKDKPFASYTLAGAEDTADRAGSSFGNGTKCLFYNVGESAFFVAWRWICAAVCRTALKISVVPGHLANEVLRNLWRSRTGGQLVDGVAH